ncbi:esterase-like [Gossypium australe]|uniref:Esterase-like n=1 Tax=Gossypium australe TaxID=47621 RepID=A0A5B6UTD1_9ROSI|nr:esterase-like [Gossypium australe]
MSSRGRGRRGRGRGRMTVSEPVRSGQGSDNEIPPPPPPPAVGVSSKLRWGTMLCRRLCCEFWKWWLEQMFREVSGVAPSTVEYWLEATERIMDELDLTPEKKLKGMVALLRDEAYQWWLTVWDGATAED